MHTKTIWHALLLVLSIAILTMTITTFMEVQKGHVALYEKLTIQTEETAETEESTNKEETEDLRNFLVYQPNGSPFEGSIPFGASEIIGHFEVVTRGIPELFIEEKSNELEIVEGEAKVECQAIVVHEAPEELINAITELPYIEKDEAGRPVVIVGDAHETTALEQDAIDAQTILVHVNLQAEGVDTFGCYANIFPGYVAIN